MTTHVDAGEDMTTESSTIDNTTSATHLAPQPPDSQLPARDRHTWMLFTDWCAAHDQPSLPTTPELLAQFLSAHPAGTVTQRRRISVIDTAHHRYGFRRRGAATISAPPLTRRAGHASTISPPVPVR